MYVAYGLEEEISHTTWQLNPQNEIIEFWDKEISPLQMDDAMKEMHKHIWSIEGIYKWKRSSKKAIIPDC